MFIECPAVANQNYVSTLLKLLGGTLKGVTDLLSSPSRADELYNQNNFQDTSRDKLDVTRGPEELSPHLM